MPEPSLSPPAAAPRAVSQLRVLLVDDESAANRWLADLLSRHDDVTVVGRATNAHRAEQLIVTLAPDVVFVDIEMPGGNGLDLLARIDGAVRVVIVTAFDDYAVEAFDTAAVDYLLKPVTAARLGRTLARLAGGRHRFNGTSPAAMAPAGESALPAMHDDKVVVPTGRATALVPADRILWVEALDNYSKVYRLGGAPLVVRRSLAEWGETLAAASFQRLDRSVIVGLDRIDAIHWRWQGGTQVSFVGSDALLLIGRAATRRLKDRVDRLP